MLLRRRLQRDEWRRLDGNTVGVVVAAQYQSGCGICGIVAGRRFQEGGCGGRSRVLLLGGGHSGRRGGGEGGGRGEGGRGGYRAGGRRGGRRGGVRRAAVVCDVLGQLLLSMLLLLLL